MGSEDGGGGGGQGVALVLRHENYIDVIMYKIWPMVHIPVHRQAIAEVLALAHKDSFFTFTTAGWAFERGVGVRGEAGRGGEGEAGVGGGEEDSNLRQ